MANREESDMGPFRRILVSTDLSEQSQRVVRYALNGLATDSGTSVHVFHVILRPPPNPLYAHYSEPSEAEQQKVRESAVAAMKQLLPESVPEGIQLQFAVAEGEPVTEVLKKADEISADVVVASTEGREGLRGFFLKSVAEAIVRSAKCPVLVVK